MRELICYLAELFGIDENTSATIVLTLFTFFVGYIITGTASLFASYKQRRNYRAIFSDVMTTIIKGVENQAKALHKSSQNFDIKNTGNYHLKTVTITHLDNFDRIDFKDVYDSFFSGIENIFSWRKLKAFNVIYSKLSFIKLIEANLFSEIATFNNRFHENELKWNEQIELLRQFTDELSTRYNGVPVGVQLATYLQELDKIIFTWQQLENRVEFFNVKTEYLDKVLLHNKTFQNLQTEDRIILRMNTIILSASHFYDNMEEALKLSSSTLSNYGYSYKASFKVMKIALTKL